MRTKKKKYNKAEVCIRTITTKEAKELLTTRKNSPQRPIFPNRVQRYAYDMSRKRWGLTGEPVILDWWGNIFDGSQRLNAIVKTGIDMSTVVVTGIDPSLFPLVDGGRSRTLSDHLYGLKKQYPNALAAALGLLDSFEYGLVCSEVARNVFTSDVGIYLLGVNQGLQDYMPKGAKLNDRRILSTSTSAVYHYIMAKYGHKKQGDEFFDKLLKGTDFESVFDPIYLLREILIKNQKTKVGKLRRTAKIALLIKAWNAFIKGETIKSLTWRGSQCPNEPMPLMILKNWSPPNQKKRKKI